MSNSVDIVAPTAKLNCLDILAPAAKLNHLYDAALAAKSSNLDIAAASDLSRHATQLHLALAAKSNL